MTRREAGLERPLGVGDGNNRNNFIFMYTATDLIKLNFGQISY